MFRNHWSVENSLHHVKDRSWDEDVHTLRRPGLGEVYATLVNTGLNALRLEGWFPPRMSMPLRAKTCAFRPTQTTGCPTPPGLGVLCIASAARVLQPSSDTSVFGPTSEMSSGNSYRIS